MKFARSKQVFWLVLGLSCDVDEHDDTQERRLVSLPGTAAPADNTVQEHAADTVDEIEDTNSLRTDGSREPGQATEITDRGRPQAAIGCIEGCTTTAVGGSIGVHTNTRYCGNVQSGGCDIEDSAAANVYLIDSYPSANNYWTCKAYSSTTASFNLQTCCATCAGT